ncbi:MAG TPA: M17 family peptidase N-terminal domain-containing protein, partial [Thermoanaerobaculia bacterium]|nr:M17 family peptidase N-terminal domain-containing protein [Thermoanaerobaculia bacterium]
MQVTITHEPKLQKIDHLFILAGEKSRELDLPPALRKAAGELMAGSGFGGRADETLTALSDAPRKTTLIGIGKAGDFSIRTLRNALYSAGKIAGKQRDRRIAVVVPYDVPGFDAAETLRLAASVLAHADYKYDAYITVKKEEKQPSIEATLVAREGLERKAVRELDRQARILAEALRTVRDLGNAPPNLITPTRLARRAEEMAKEVGVRATVHGRKDIERMKMGGLLAVNRGSAEEPRFIVLEYAPRRAVRHVALVGKGITFDSGGISIKPAEKMEEMKFDMCGAAAVIGVVEAAAKLELPVRIT